MLSDLGHLLESLVDDYVCLEFFGMRLGRDFDGVQHLRGVERTDRGFALDCSEGNAYLKVELVEPERFVMKRKPGGARERTVDVYARKVAVEWVQAPRSRWNSAEKSSWTMEAAGQDGGLVTVESSVFTAEDGRRADETVQTRAPALKVFSGSA